MGHSIRPSSSYISRTITASPDCKWIVSGSLDNSTKIWDHETYEEKVSLVGHGQYVLSVAVTKDNNYVVTGSYDHNIKIWTLPEG